MADVLCAAIGFGTKPPFMMPSSRNLRYAIPRSKKFSNTSAKLLVAAPLAATNYTDALALSDVTTYGVTAVNSSAQESPRRTATVCPVRLSLIADSNNPLLINYFDQIQTGITNLASAAEGQAAIVNATGEAVNKAFSAALQAAVKSTPTP